MKNIFCALGVVLVFYTNLAIGSEAGMPQLNPEFWVSQIFWLIVTFAILYLIIWKVFLPTIMLVQYNDNRWLTFLINGLTTLNEKPLNFSFPVSLCDLSNVISFQENQFTKNLPNIFGKEAAKNFKSFLDELKSNNFYYKKVKNYYFFKIGRWDVELLNNKIIKFPVNNLAKAINKSIDLLNRDDFENYNVIDLRINDKIIVK